jgi:hypothetical protein
MAIAMAAGSLFLKVTAASFCANEPFVAARDALP